MFQSMKGYVDHILALRQKSEKAQKKKHWVYVGFMDLEKEYDKNNRATLADAENI